MMAAYIVKRSPSVYRHGGIVFYAGRLEEIYAVWGMHRYTPLATVVASYRATSLTSAARLREERATGRKMPTGGSPHPEGFSRIRHGDAPQAVRIRLLGDFEVSLENRTIEDASWRLRKAASLVKLLALAEGHRLHRERVMFLLWPDLAKKAASNNLRGTIHAARKAMGEAGPRCLVSEDELLLLCPGSDLWVDAEVFEEATLAVRRSRNPAAFRLAIDLYAGELLPGDRYEEWTEGRREGLRQMYLALLIDLAGLHEERDEHGPAIEALRKAVGEEPTNEGAHANLMRLHTRTGRPEQALAQYERLRAALRRELGTQPAPTTRRLRDEIVSGKHKPSSSATPSLREEESLGADGHNLPAPRTSFVGREIEILEVKRTLATTRLLTLTGPGGSGKTRLALEVARDLVSAYPDGVRLVKLAPLSDPGLVAQAVAGALEVSERPDQPLADTLADDLRDRKLLLIMDNCEHLVEAAARLIDDFLYSCPRLRVLATSRELLGISGEVNRVVPSLSLPDNGESTIESRMRYEAVRLFVDRARLRLPDFELTRENAGAVVRVCRKLDGIPLAIELATARMGALAVEQVAQRLEVSLDVLKGASRGAAPRQQTLRATLDWSHRLLSEPERALLRRLSVFAGGGTLEAVEAVCSGEGIGRGDVLDLLGDLVDKSLVVARMDTVGAVRYGMLKIIRQYAREKLEESAEAGKTQGQHAAFFLALAEEAEPELAGAQQGLWVERLESEHDNLRAALSWVLEREESELGLRFGAALWRYWYSRDYLSEGIGWMGQVLADGGPSVERLDALEGMGWLTQKQGDVERARSTYEGMLELSRKLDDGGNLATALNSLGTLAASTGDNEEAKRYLEENLSVLERLEGEGYQTTPKRYHASNLLGLLALNEDGDPARASVLWRESLALARETGDAVRIGVSLCNLGYAAVLQGDNERATALCAEALAYADENIIPETLINLGLAALGQGDHGRAISSFERSLAISQSAGIKASIINALEGMASLAGARGNAPQAARLWGAAGAGRETTGIALPPGELVLHEPHLASARARLGDTAWLEALAEGRAMSLEEAAEYALSKKAADPTTTPVPPKRPASDLSAREREVALLVARGFTNRQISIELGLSERTAGNHVARILRKLGLRSRTQIATWATERGLPGSDQD
jgi:predicted ATPase/DNA-binding SARP family transcriptional activator/DNA-binding CsgD family transcriptional regulator